MDDTESSDFLSSSDSLWSSSNTTTSSTNHEDPSYVGFDVFLSDNLTEPTKGEKNFEGVRMIPNSRLTSASHPVLIHLEKEYQARRSLWHQHTGQYCTYSGEIEGRTRCPSRSKLTNRGSPPVGRNQDKQLKDLVFPDGLNLEAPQGLKRQRILEAKELVHQWKERRDMNLQITDGDRVFAEKCRELQGFIQPLTELLNGLKRGRYDRGLSSFQQSVAMDRIQRIVGVLQKPEMGERYLSTLLQVEMMLKIWFPGVSSSSSSSSSSSDFDMEEPQNKIAKHPNIGSIGQKSCHVQPVQCTSSPTTTKPLECHDISQVHTDCVCCKDVLMELPTMNMTWMHTAPICNPPLSQVDLHHFNTTLGQDLLWPSGNSCGIVFLVQNNQSSECTKEESFNNRDKPLDLCFYKEGTQERLPRRSQSDPSLFPLCDQTEHGQLQNRSHSLTRLPTCTLTSGGEKT
ncbi:circadian-associated transcriptional repressor [Pyxicephalus adspersus]